MSLILALGSNIGDSQNSLNRAIELIHSSFPVIAKSQIYSSPAIEYEDQPDFLNMAIECELPSLSADQAMNKLLEIEALLGRKRTVSKGPRTIDIDIIFWGTESFKTNTVTIPHPAWQDRSFVVRPILELPYATILQQHFPFPNDFENTASPLKN
jgi:2-amino-4-hydroxy-6-hydroxymethyldihydropteridine diphosphokinase